MKRKKEPDQRTLDPKSLSKWLTLFVAAALAVAACLFCFMRYVIFKNAPNDKIADVISSTSTLLGVFTIGGAALIQLRKHIIFEEQSKLDRDGKMSDRLTRAIENLHNKDSLAVREGALFELKRLGLDFPREPENIVRILSSFVKDGIETRKLVKGPASDKEFLPKPTQDVFIACEIMSTFFEKSQCRASLNYLKAEKLYLHNIQLRGADLYYAHLEGSILNDSNFEDADMLEAHLIGAYLVGANFEGTKNLAAEQLLSAKNIDKAHLSPSLCADYDRLLAEQTTTNPEA